MNVAWTLSLLAALVLAGEQGLRQFPRGHLKPIGNQNYIIRGGIDEYSYTIPSRVFYRDYWKPGKPVVFRGAMKHSSAMLNWVNDTYMKANFGSVAGLVDRRTTWEKGGIEAPPRSVMNYSDFLDRVRREQLYWDDVIRPDQKILSDIPLGIFLSCEGLLEQVQYINLMVNSGNVSYVLHNDASDNLFHFIAGRKRWLIANSTFAESLYIGNDTETPTMSPVVPDRVDLQKFPRVSEVVFFELELHPGDILYVPRDWPHYVRSSGFPNIALNIWISSKEQAAKSPMEPKCNRQNLSAYTLLKRKMK